MSSKELWILLMRRRVWGRRDGDISPQPALPGGSCRGLRGHGLLGDPLRHIMRARTFGWVGQRWGAPVRRERWVVDSARWIRTQGRVRVRRSRGVGRQRCASSYRTSGVFQTRFPWYFLRGRNRINHENQLCSDGCHNPEKLM